MVRCCPEFVRECGGYVTLHETRTGKLSGRGEAASMQNDLKYLACA
jgi:hypothetical protein